MKRILGLVSVLLIGTILLVSCSTNKTTNTSTTTSSSTTTSTSTSPTSTTKSTTTSTISPTSTTTVITTPNVPADHFTNGVLNAANQSCLTCHSSGNLAVPVNHTGLTIDLCLTCHILASATTTTTLDLTPKIPADHFTNGVLNSDRQMCLGCHPLSDLSAAHATRTVEDCQLCHKPAA